MTLLYLRSEMLIVARVRMSSLVTMPMCTVAFTAVSYKRPCCKCRLKPIRAHFQMRLSSEPLTSMSLTPSESGELVFVSL